MKSNAYEQSHGDVRTNQGEVEALASIDVGYLKESLNVQADRIEDAVKSLEVKINSLAEQNPKKADKLRRVLKNLWSRFLFSFEVAGVLFLAGTVNYERTRYNLTEHLNPDKSISYVHEDEETTRILEFLSGRGELDRITRFKLAQSGIIEIFNDNNVKYPKELKTVSEEEFLKIISRMAKDNEHNDFINSFNRMIGIRESNWLSDFVPDHLDRADGVYKALWKVEELSGNPKVRWLDTDWDISKQIAIRIGGGAHYAPATNTVYISSPGSETSFSTDYAKGIQSLASVDDFVAEASHAKQMKEEPFSNLVSGFRDEIFTLVRTLKTGDLVESYRLNYKNPGALEYEAHSTIEPELRKKFNEELKPKLEKPTHRRGH